MINMTTIDKQTRRRSSTLNPLPFVSPPPQPRPSLTDRLMRSTYLFPKTLSNPRMMNNANDDNVIVIDDERSPTIETKASLKKGNHMIHNNSQIFSSKNHFQLPPRPSTTTPIQKLKKSVHFHNKITSELTLINIPLSSKMTTREKHRQWYNANEYDQFKYQAAKQAGVKIVRYDSVKVGQHANFVMMGDFDGTKSGKSHYNENEYNDAQHCKRGLGYHFSRSRKKSQTATRSAVVAWQTTLRDQSLNQSASSSSLQTDLERKKHREEKSRMMLACVSAKCSRKAREEAKWRGDVDYRVAYPERHVLASCDGGANNNVNSSIMANTPKKRVAVDNVVDLTGSTSPSVATPSYKRQRRAGCYNREQLSPVTIGYMASGVPQQAEV